MDMLRFICVGEISLLVKRNTCLSLKVALRTRKACMRRKSSEVQANPWLRSCGSSETDLLKPLNQSKAFTLCLEFDDATDLFADTDVVKR
jgi:hypothetical protein